MSKPTKVDPHQNVSPTQSTHFGPTAHDGRRIVRPESGATISSGGGCPLRLSLAAGIAGHMCSADPSNGTLEICLFAFNMADALIAKYNADVDDKNESG